MIHTRPRFTKNNNDNIHKIVEVYIYIYFYTNKNIEKSFVSMDTMLFIIY